MLDSLLGSATDFLGGIVDTIGDKIGDTFLNALNTFIGVLLYYLDIAECAILHMAYKFFAVFAGLTRVVYKGEQDYLINVFFSNSSISNIYWAMAIIGVVMSFAFAIWAVARKMFDMNDTERRSLGGILGSLFKSILIIVAMNFIMVITLNVTNVLLQRINYAFDHAEHLDDPSTIVYSSEDYVYMNEIMETIGTYAMNPSYSSRYNINSCFNSIRPALLALQQNGVFDVYYVTQTNITTDGTQQLVEIDTWQSVLQEIARSTSLTSDVAIDVYHEALTNAILHAMTVLKTNNNFYPLKYYQATYQPTSTVDLDVVIFMTGTGNAAKNNAYNENVSITDALRGAYVNGEKSIYNRQDVTSDFNIGLDGMNHLLIIVLCILLIRELVIISLTAVVRIFQLIVLYLVAPPVIAVMPMDNGEKFKQWVTAFVVQAFSLIATVISMRILILFIPIILSSDLVLFENPVLNLAAKAFMIFGGTVAAERATGMITGILSGQAGYQSVAAGNVRGDADNMMKETGLGDLAKAPLKYGARGLRAGAGMAAGAASAAAGGALGMAKTGMSNVGAFVSSAWSMSGLGGSKDSGPLGGSSSGSNSGGGSSSGGHGGLGGTPGNGSGSSAKSGPSGGKGNLGGTKDSGPNGSKPSANASSNVGGKGSLGGTPDKGAAGSNAAGSASGTTGGMSGLGGQSTGGDSALDANKGSIGGEGDKGVNQAAESTGSNSVFDNLSSGGDGSTMTDSMGSLGGESDSGFDGGSADSPASFDNGTLGGDFSGGSSSDGSYVPSETSNLGGDADHGFGGGSYTDAAGGFVNAGVSGEPGSLGGMADLGGNSGNTFVSGGGSSSVSNGGSSFVSGGGNSSVSNGGSSFVSGGGSSSVSNGGSTFVSGGGNASATNGSSFSGNGSYGSSSIPSGVSHLGGTSDSVAGSGYSTSGNSGSTASYGGGSYVSGNSGSSASYGGGSYVSGNSGSTASYGGGSYVSGNSGSTASHGGGSYVSGNSGSASSSGSSSYVPNRTSHLGGTSDSAYSSYGASSRSYSGSNRADNTVFSSANGFNNSSAGYGRAGTSNVTQTTNSTTTNYGGSVGSAPVQSGSNPYIKNVTPEQDRNFKNLFGENYRQSKSGDGSDSSSKPKK